MLPSSLRERRRRRKRRKQIEKIEPIFLPPKETIELGAALVELGKTIIDVGTAIKRKRDERDKRKR